MLLIMWGFKNRLTRIGSGRFPCPICRVERAYTLSKLRRWFTLFWVPLVPGKVKAHIVTCDTCGTRFEESVLANAAPAVAAPSPASFVTAPWEPPSGPAGYSNN